MTSAHPVFCFCFNKTMVLDCSVSTESDGRRMSKKRKKAALQSAGAHKFVGSSLVEQYQYPKSCPVNQQFRDASQL